MKKLNLFSDLWSSVVGSQKDNGSTRYRLVIVSLSTRYRVWQYSLGKIAAVVCMLLTIGIGNAWGAADVVYMFASATDNPGNGVAWTSDYIDPYTQWSTTGGSSPAFYTESYAYRAYNGATFTITSTRRMASITLYFSGTSYTFSTGNTNVTQTVSPNTTSYSWNVSRTCRLRKIAITYVTGGVVAGDYDLLTDVGDLVAGDKVIILNTGGSQAISTTQGDNNRGQSNNFTKSSNTVTLSSESTTVQVFTVNECGSNWNFYAINGSSLGYIYAASSSKNYLKTRDDDNDGDSRWFISLNGSKEATITAQGSSTHNILKYNTNLFSCYTTGQTAIKIYKKKPTCTTNPTVTASSYSDVTVTTARVTCASGISSAGSTNCDIISYGFVVGSSTNPAIGGSGVTQYEVGTYIATSTSFHKDLTDLSAGTTYYVRPYAINQNGTAYGTQTSFTTISGPTLTVSETARAFGDKKVNGSSTMTFTISGIYLTGNIGLSISGTNAAMFTIDKESLTPSSGSVASTTITVTYAPTSAGSHSAQINITSSGATTKTVALSGTGKWEVTWMRDGSVYERTLVANGARPTFPAVNPTSTDAVSTEFYGWSTTEWVGKIDDLTDKTVYTSNSTMSTVSNNNRVYYAVFSKVVYADGSIPVNTVMWAETWTGATTATTANDAATPSSNCSTSKGTTMYSGASITYTQSTNSVYCRNENTGGGTKPELLLSNAETWTISGIPTGKATELALTYVSNNTKSSVTCSTLGASVSGSSNNYTITTGGATTITLVFNCSGNTRIDNVELKVKTRPATYMRFLTNSSEYMYVTSAKDILTQSSMTMTINRSLIKSGSVSIADATGDQGGTFHAVVTNGTADPSTGLNATVNIQYTPNKANVSESATMTVEIGPSGSVDTYDFTVYGRSLPETFAIVGKVGAVWTALPADALSSGLHAGYGLTVDDTDAPTEATLAPEAALYKYYARTTKGADYIRLAGSENNKALWSSSSNGIKVWAAINGGSATGDSYEWQLATTDNVTYTLWNKAANSGAGRNLGINSDKKWGMHATAATNELRFLPVTSTATYIAMNVTNWGGTTFTFTTVDVIPSYSSITVLYGDESFSATMSGSGPYTLSISGIDFSAHSGEQLVVQWKDGSGNAVAQGAIITPIFISSANTNFEGYDIDILPTNDVLITNGATLTITTNSLSVRNLTVEGGSMLNISTTGGGAGVTFHMNSLSLRGGWTTINDEQTYDMPRVYINPASTLTKTQTTVNMDISVNKNNYYPFAVPFPVAVSAVDYADSYLASHSTYGTHYVVKKYNGENRAINGSVDANWVVVESGETLQPGTGYILTAVPVGGEAVIRFPMIFANTWTTGGEKGSITVDAVTTTKNVIPVSAYSGAAATEDKRHAGWNLLGVPFMACYKTDDGMHNQADGFLTGKMTLSGDPSDPYDWADDGAIYVSVPTHDFSEYLQFDITDDDTKLLPGWCFFMQIAKDGYLTFDVSDQQSSSDLPIYAPQRANDDKPVVKTGIVLSDGNKSDKTTLLISDRYSAEYEVGADLEKMFGNDYTLATYSVAGNTPLAFNAMSTAQAKGLIPIGVRLPENGEYTFSLNSRYADVNIDRLDLIDYETGEITNLMQGDYTFTATRCQTEERFALNVTQRKDTPTGNEQIDSGGGRVRKVVIEDKLFILRDGLLYNATGQRVMTINE